MTAPDPSTTFLGERAWKAHARTAAIDALRYQLGQIGLLVQAETRSEQLVDGILGTIGPLYEAAIRDAVVGYMRLIAPDFCHPGNEVDDYSGSPELLLVNAFLWRRVPPETMEALRVQRDS